MTCQYRTALHFVNGTVTSPYYLNDIINPVIVPLHEQHRPNFIFMDDNAPAHRGPEKPSTSPKPNNSTPTELEFTTTGRGAKKEVEPEEAREELLCDFDPCVHLQQPCPELREIKRWSCRCLGLTSDSSVTPGPVVALDVTRVWPRAASVRWCAPHSTLNAFLVWVLRQDGSAISNGTVSSLARQTSVFGLEAGHVYSVCVSALNGDRVSHERCVPVATPRDSKAIAMYALKGGCTALLLIAVVLAVAYERRGYLLNNHFSLNPLSNDVLP
uniref:Fibronectin type-III domain-containing protein n=1 Tax=Myripristis murdjan TaxID=586833 RepID=A0A667YQE0_9TELE